MLPSHGRLIMVTLMASSARISAACNERLAKCLQSTVLPDFMTVSFDRKLITVSPNLLAQLGLSTSTNSQIIWVGGSCTCSAMGENYWNKLLDP